MQKIYALRIFFLLIYISIFADEVQVMDFSPHPIPWFTGPLLAPSARVIPPKHLKVKIHWDSYITFGKYNSHWQTASIENFYSEEIRIQFKVGLIKRVEFQIEPSIIYQKTDGENAVNFGDLPLGLNVQILGPYTIHGEPNLKLSLLANAPTGKYQHLNGHKKQTDATGSGCWFPGLGLNLSQLWYFSDHHYLQLRAMFHYRFGVPVHVKGNNSYGGDASTRGTVYPGNYFIFDTALLYSFTQNWAGSCDFRYRHQNSNRYSLRGVKPASSSGEEFSLAPALEYNFSKKLGIIGGLWFTIAGRNVAQFINGILSLTAYF